MKRYLKILGTFLLRIIVAVEFVIAIIFFALGIDQILLANF